MIGNGTTKPNVFESHLFKFQCISGFTPRTSTLANKILKDINDGGNFGRALEENRILIILRHYIKYLPDATKEILYIPYEKFTRKKRGLTS